MNKGIQSVHREFSDVDMSEEEIRAIKETIKQRAIMHVDALVTKSAFPVDLPTIGMVIETIQKL